MAINNFKPFALDPNANVMSQADWEALPALLSGFTAGKASSAQVNKAIRQASFIAAALAQYTSDKTGDDVLDDGDQAAFIAKMAAAFGKDFQPLDATLTALAALIGSADKLAYFNGDDTAALTALTTVGRSVIGQTSIPNLLSYLGISSRSLVITSSQTVTSIPAWVTSIRVSACAGGGGGGSGASNNTGQSSLVGGGGGGGGGGGQSILRSPYTITAGQSLSVTIGSGGKGGTGVTTGPGTSGGNGGTTSIAGLFTLTGGTGGDNGGAVTYNSLGNGGPGGIGGLGYPAGSCGGDGNYAGNGGAGASTAFGGGGGGARAVKSNPSEPRFQGQPAFGYGSGGGGSGGAYGVSTALSSYAGGNGAPGIVIIEW